MTDRFNTIAGWTLFAGVVALGLSAISSRIFHADDPERPEQLGYVIEGVEEEGGADEGPSLALLLNEGSASAGESVFAKCSACHTIEQGGADGIGPNLYGVLGTQIAGHAPGFAYSSALSDKEGQWDYETMSEWLESPRGFASGTKMSFAGLGSAEDRANVMLYLRENGGGPALPEPPAPEPEGDAADSETSEGDVDGAGEGPGPADGELGDNAAAAGAMSAEQPTPGEASTN